MDHMEQTEACCRSNELDICPQLSAVEMFILSFLQNNPTLAEPYIDIMSLQMACSQQGYSPREYSYGFVRLLTIGLLAPHGEFRYVLAPEGRSMKLAGNSYIVEKWVMPK